ncbi:MAG: ABA4-like family protein [Proteobacteria bacterium]|nr:ABA4-like family protein [Pseudomonadota bacterium]
MSPDQIFLVCNYGVIPAWLLLVLAPGWSWTQRVVHAVWIPVLLGAVYGWAFVSNPGTPPGGSFGTLEGVMVLFTAPWVALAGWVHYLAFDLFVGAWQVRDGRRRGLHHGWLIPCLILTLMAGPLGLLLYLLLRFALTRETSLLEGAEGSPKPV